MRFTSWVKTHFVVPSLRDVGDVDGRFPAGNYLQNINGDGAYLQARVKMMDFFGQVYAPEPFKSQDFRRDVGRPVAKISYGI